MGILNKLMFWRRDDEFDFDKMAEHESQGDIFKGDDLGLDHKPVGLDEKSPFDDLDVEHEQTVQSLPPHPQQPRSSFTERQPQQTATIPAISVNRDLELISSKLDTIKAILTSMDQRISNLERAAGVVERKERLW